MIVLKIVTGIGKKVGNQYFINILEIKELDATLVTSEQPLQSIITWHQRTHCSNKKLHKLIVNDLVVLNL